MARIWWLASAFLLSAPALGQEVTMPFAIISATDEPAIHDSYNLPVGPWKDGVLPVRVFEGMVANHVWRLAAKDETSLSIMAPLRDQLAEQGYEIVLDCKTRDCGGFDFRFAIDVRPEPQMHVDLGDFRFVSAVKGEEAISLLVSRSADTGFVQMVSVTAAENAISVEGPLGGMAAEPDDIPARLAAGLPLVLDDLVFASGSANLVGGQDEALAPLADWLVGNPQHRLILVGHSDSSGNETANIRLSRQRAEAVRQALTRWPGVSAARIEVQGIGPFAPRDSNLTAAGRARNRRVEALPVPG